MNTLYETQKQAIRNAAMQHPECIIEPFDLVFGMDWFETIYTLAEDSGGRQLYLPFPRKIFIKCIEAEAREEYKNEGNKPLIHARLAKKYGLSETHMRRLLAGI